MISFIIPLFNKESYIHNTLLSLNKFTEIISEVIVIDDYSSDNSFNIVKQNSIQYNNEMIILRNDSNRGVSYTRNRGLDCAKGKYIIFLDADDELVPDIDLMSLLNFMNSSNANITLLTREYYGKKIVPRIKVYDTNLDRVNGNVFKILDISKYIKNYGFTFGGSASSIIKKDKIVDKFVVGESHFEDWDFLLKIVYNSEVYVYNTKAIKVNYDAESLSNSVNVINLNTLLSKKPSIFLTLKYLGSKQIYRKFYWIWYSSIIKRVRKRDVLMLLYKEKINFMKNIQINKHFLYSLFTTITLGMLK